MKNSIKVFLGAIISILLFGNVSAQEFKWETKSPQAKELAKRAVSHLLNVEYELAYDRFQEALKLDPNFTAAQVGLGTLTIGETRKAWAEKAKQSVSGKSEGEKLFVSLLDAEDRAARADVWKKLYSMYPSDPFMEYSYISRMADTTQLMNSMLNYVKKYPSRPEAYNTLGYLYLQFKKDTVTAKNFFEKYIEKYPDGYNPYDSMGEFYYLTGDMENSKKYYKKSLEHYPFCYSSRQKMEELDKMK